MHKSVKEQLVVSALICGTGLGGLCPPADAQEAAPAAPAAEAVRQVNPRAERERGYAQEKSKAAKATREKAAKCDGDIQAAAVALAETQERYAAALEELAAAIETRDDKKLGSLPLRELDRLEGRAISRLKALESIVAPGQPIDPSLTADIPEDGRGVIESYAHSRNSLVRAYQALAEKSTPEATQIEYEDALDLVRDKEDEMQVAASALRAAQEKGQRNKTRTRYNTPEMNDALNNLDAASNAHLEGVRALNEATATLRRRERAMQRAHAAVGELAKRLDNPPPATPAAAPVAPVAPAAPQTPTPPAAPPAPSAAEPSPAVAE